MIMMMEFFLLVLFVAVKLSVTQDIVTVSNVPVQQGQSIIIPCLYNAKYVHNSKYLCSNKCIFKYAPFCNNVTRINQRPVSIVDDQTQHLFTVTMKNVTTSHTGCYSCAVNIPGSNEVKKVFQLKVTEVTPELYVDNQLVIGYEGSHVVISCRHQTKKPKAWCKIGDACVETTGNINGASVQLKSMDWGFSVTMSELTMNNTGWYWCSIGDEQMPVHITVQSRTTNWKSRSSFAWVVFLGFLLAVAVSLAVVMFRLRNQKCKMLHTRSENVYVSMRKPTKQHEANVENQDYEIMSCPEQRLEIQQEKNPEGNKSPKTDGGHITCKDGFSLKGSYTTQ